jgi:DNA-directed RNA polymerase specialized sigma24 family protein
LDPDAGAAATLYNRHRDRLVQYFGWQQCEDVEALADEVIDRVARRLAEGEAIERPGAYMLGVARLVVLEQRQRFEQRRGALAEYERRRQVLDSEPADAERAMTCLERCLDQLSAERRALIVDYYTGSPAERLGRRQALGARLGLLPGALRNRALRIRQDLERCVDGCLHGKQRDVGGLSVTPDSGRGDGGGAR